MLGDDIAGLLGFRAASADMDGLTGVLVASVETSVVNGSTQNSARTAVHAIAAGIQNREWTRASATLACMRVARCGGAAIAR